MKNSKLFGFFYGVFIFFETPSMFEPAFVEELISSDSESQDPKDKDKTSKTYSDTLWEYR